MKATVKVRVSEFKISERASVGTHSHATLSTHHGETLPGLNTSQIVWIVFTLWTTAIYMGREALTIFTRAIVIRAAQTFENLKTRWAAYLSVDML